MLAVKDERFGDESPCEGADDVAVTISILFNPWNSAI